MNAAPPSLDKPPLRIVSLVPSITESLFALGLGERVVGVTEWCVHPKDEVARLPTIGGTKNPDVDAIAALAPDLVIANHEENTRRAVGQLEERGLRVWVTYPRSVRDGALLLGQLADAAGLPRDHALRAEVADATLAAVEDAERALRAEQGHAPLRVFCPIWRDPWMTIGSDTYVHDMLRLCGGDNVFADEGDRRYPIVDLERVVAAAPEVVLLPDEPYRFGTADAAEIAAMDIPAARSGRVHLIDGTWVSWYGPRIAPAVRALRGLLAP